MKANNFSTTHKHKIWIQFLNYCLFLWFCFSNFALILFCLWLLFYFTLHNLLLFFIYLFIFFCFFFISKFFIPLLLGIKDDSHINYINIKVCTKKLCFIVFMSVCISLSLYISIYIHVRIYFSSLLLF